jgi:hypothetical protein
MLGAMTWGNLGLVVIFLVATAFLSWIVPIMIAAVLRRVRYQREGHTKYVVSHGHLHLVTLFFRLLFIVTGFVLSMQAIGVDVLHIVIILGFSTYLFAWGFQNTVSNAISGFMIMAEAKTQPGRHVVVMGYEGVVLNTDLRNTELRLLKNPDEIVAIPNASFDQSPVKYLSPRVPPSSLKTTKPSIVHASTTRHGSLPSERAVKLPTQQIRSRAKGDGGGQHRFYWKTGTTAPPSEMEEMD